MRTLGSRYVLHELLGQGTTGEVWRATRRDDGADVAVKMLRPEFADDQVVVDRFLREWRILYDIDSPELVRVLDLVNERDALAIVMELVEGPDLREYLRHEAPLPVGDATRIVTQVLWALETVHKAGVVHRDVKPENVLLDERRGGPLAVRLTDFGIARMVDSLSRGRTPATGPIGTPLYMAPELGTGGQPTAAVDIYSAGILFYELLAGMPPFDEAHPTDMLRAHVEQEPLPIKGVPRPVWDVLARMLEKSPKKRPRSAAAAAEALEEALRSSGVAEQHGRRQESRDEDTLEQRGARADRSEDTMVSSRRMVAVGAAAGAVGMSKEAQTDTRGQGGYGRGYDDDWDDDAATGLVPPVRGGDQGGWDDDRWDEGATSLVPPVRGGQGGWDDDDLATSIGPAVGGPPRGRGGWDEDFDDYEDPPTGAAEVIPAPAGATRSDRNTLPSAIPASHQPRPAGGHPPTRDNRQRLRIAAGAALVVALIAGAGGWALAASGGKSDGGETTIDSTAATTGVLSTPYVDVSGNIIDPTATAPYVTEMPGGQIVTVHPVAPGSTPPPAASSQPNARTSTNAGSQSTQATTKAATTSSSPTPTSGTVPDVRGKSQASAEAALSDAGFKYSESQTCYDASTTVGQVQKQSPAGGTTADFTTTVTIDIAADCQDVPSVVGSSVSGATSTLQGAGFSVGVMGSSPWNPASCQYGTSRVDNQYPAGGTRQVRGGWVNINYSCKASPPPSESSS